MPTHISEYIEAIESMQFVENMTNAFNLVEAWCIENNIPKDHGFDHYKKVFGSSCQGIEMYFEDPLNQAITRSDGFCIVVASLLHDVDDRKIASLKAVQSTESKNAVRVGLQLPVEAAHQSSETTDAPVDTKTDAPVDTKIDAPTETDESADVDTSRQPTLDNPFGWFHDYNMGGMVCSRTKYHASIEEAYPVALDIMRKSRFPSHQMALIIEMISLVACSKNGNSVVEPRWKLVPRDADRLEALGLVGIQRWYEYSRRSGIPLMTQTTPMPTDEQQLHEVMKGRTLESYVASGGKSVSAMDHWYDKLLLIGTFESQNEYLISKREPLIELMLARLFQYNAQILGLQKSGTTNVTWSDVNFNTDL